MAETPTFVILPVPDSAYVAQAFQQITEILAAVQRLAQQMETLMSDQSQTDANVQAATQAITTLTTQINAQTTDIDSALAEIQQRIAALNVPQADLDALNAAVATISTASSNLSALHDQAQADATADGPPATGS